MFLIHLRPILIPCISPLPSIVFIRIFTAHFKLSIWQQTGPAPKRKRLSSVSPQKESLRAKRYPPLLARHATGGRHRGCCRGRHRQRCCRLSVDPLFHRSSSPVATDDAFLKKTFFLTDSPGKWALPIFLLDSSLKRSGHHSLAETRRDSRIAN